MPVDQTDILWSQQQAKTEINVFVITPPIVKSHAICLSVQSQQVKTLNMPFLQHIL